MAKPHKDRVDHLVRAASLDPLTATLLVNRGIHTAEAARDFLALSFHTIRPPQAVKDLHLAAERLARAIRESETVLVFGDYDVDGVTATALLVEFILEAGGRAVFHIPHRLSEGYGLSREHIDRVALREGATLIVTVDCGITSFDAVRRAAEAGIDVIITDHHIPSGELPDAIAVVNPKRADCDACLDHLAGVGMAFYLVILLRARLREEGHWQGGTEPNLKRSCDLVALGTVADMVPLVKENRAFTGAGLDLISRGTRPGIRALAEVSGLGGLRVEAGDIAFKLAPRINAAGRLDDARQAVELLLCRSSGRARELAMTLDSLNTERQDIERRLLEDIDEQIADRPDLLDRSVIVLASPSWHEGVLGIAASKTARRHGRPTALFSIRDATAKGSARSVDGLDLYAALEACRCELIAFGGHAMAAGLKVRTERLIPFRDRFDRVASAALESVPVPETLRIDAEIDFAQVTPGTMAAIDRLKPFGNGNPEPLFMARRLEIETPRIVGGRHLKCTLRQTTPDGTRRLPAIEFNRNGGGLTPRRFDEAVFYLRWNEWNGSRCIQAVVVGTRTSNG